MWHNYRFWHLKTAAESFGNMLKNRLQIFNEYDLIRANKVDVWQPAMCAPKREVREHRDLQICKNNTKTH